MYNTAAYLGRLVFSLLIFCSTILQSHPFQGAKSTPDINRAGLMLLATGYSLKLQPIMVWKDEAPQTISPASWEQFQRSWANQFGVEGDSADDLHITGKGDMDFDMPIVLRETGVYTARNTYDYRQLGKLMYLDYQDAFAPDPLCLGSTQRYIKLTAGLGMMSSLFSMANIGCAFLLAQNNADYIFAMTMTISTGMGTYCFEKLGQSFAATDHNVKKVLSYTSKPLTYKLIERYLDQHPATSS